MLQRGISRIDRWRYAQTASFCRGSVLDVGCGLGGMREWLEPRHPYTGCDLEGGNVRASALSLPFGDRTFDTVLLCEVIEHLDLPGLAIREAARVARSRIIITVPNDHSLVRLARLALGRDVEIDPEHVLSYNAFNLRVLLRRAGFAMKETFCFPLRLQGFPELKIRSRFGYWLFAIVDRVDT
jgi:SAM-dependent methyltransferase